jgi:hypothetical protein
MQTLIDTYREQILQYIENDESLKKFKPEDISNVTAEDFRAEAEYDLYDSEIDVTETNLEVMSQICYDWNVFVNDYYNRVIDTMVGIIIGAKIDIKNKSLVLEYLHKYNTELTDLLEDGLRKASSSYVSDCNITSWESFE